MEKALLKNIENPNSADIQEYTAGIEESGGFRSFTVGRLQRRQNRLFFAVGNRNDRRFRSERMGGQVFRPGECVGEEL